MLMVSGAFSSLGFSKVVARECDPLLRQLGDHTYSRASVACIPTPSVPGYILLGFRVSFMGTIYYRPRTRAFSLDLFPVSAKQQDGSVRCDEGYSFKMYS